MSCEDSKRLSSVAEDGDVTDFSAELNQWAQCCLLQQMLPAPIIQGELRESTGGVSEYPWIFIICVSKVHSVTGASTGAASSSAPIFYPLARAVIQQHNLSSGFSSVFGAAISPMSRREPRFGVDGCDRWVISTAPKPTKSAPPRLSHRAPAFAHYDLPSAAFRTAWYCKYHDRIPRFSCAVGCRPVSTVKSVSHLASLSFHSL